MNNDKKWFENTVIYEIYPLSFKDSNGDGYGDLPGIIEKLDYVKSLGVGAIWLAPFYKSPMHDFGYDVSDHSEVDPLFGYMFDFEQLVSLAHERGVKVTIDLVLNHTSDEHPWFKESKSSKNNPKRDWYIWHRGKEVNGEKLPPNNWLSVFGGSAWSQDKVMTDKWYLHTFLPSQPDLNLRNPEVKNEIFKIIDFWLTKGVDGFRGDAINHLFEDSSFEDEPSNLDFRVGEDDPYDSLLHTRTQGLPKTIQTILEISKHIKKYGDIFFVTEAYLDLKGLLHVYRNCGAPNHAPFNFNLMSLPWETHAFKEFLDGFLEGAKDFPKTYVIGNHDHSRVASRMGIEKAKILALLCIILPGASFVYYGDEIGMIDLEISRKEIQDEWGKQARHQNAGRDPERGVMQWNNQTYAGFSVVKPWIKEPEDYKEKNVSSQEKNPKSILSFYKKLISLKKEEPFANGEYVPIPTQGSILCFQIISGDSKAAVFVNMSSKESPIQTENSSGTILSTFMDNPNPSLPLRPDEARIISFD